MNGFLCNGCGSPTAPLPLTLCAACGGNFYRLPTDEQEQLLKQVDDAKSDQASQFIDSDTTLDSDLWPYDFPLF